MVMGKSEKLMFNHTKKMAASILLGLAAGFSICPYPAMPQAEAADVAGMIGSLIYGAAAYKQMDEYLDTVNNTEEGRQKYFEELKKSQGVSYDSYYNSMLDSIMTNLSAGIAASDPSIRQKPFLYFLNPSTEFNAACGLGHVMTVNIGLFKISDNTDEVAFVLGHEMGHGMKNHAMNGTKKKLRTIIGGSVTASAMGGGVLANLTMSALVGQINNVQITKKQEWEADNLAFDYCYQAGYNPGAGAALWERVEEKQGEFKNSLVGEIFSPDDHPTNRERMENYEKKLVKLSGNHVTIKKDSNMVQVNGKDFVTPSATSGMSSAERKYFVMGNLAAAYNHGQNVKEAYASDGTVYLGNQSILTPTGSDPSAEVLAKKLNEIK